MPIQPKQQPPYYTPGTTSPVKEYEALITQSGTSNIVVIELKNTIGTIIWTREGAGNYKGTLTGAFPLSKTYIPGQSTIDGTNGIFLPIWDQNGILNGYYALYRTDDNSITILFTDEEGNFVDMNTLLSTSTLALPTIKVYQ